MIGLLIAVTRTLLGLVGSCLLVFHHPPFREKGSLTACGGGRDGLAELSVRTVTACKNAISACRGVSLCFDVALWVHVELPFEDIGSWPVTNGNKKSIAWDFGYRFGFDVLHLDAGEFVCTEALDNHGIPDGLDRRFGHFLLHR